MLPPSAIFLNFILPALIVAAGLVLGWGVPRKGGQSQGRRDGRWIGALAVGAGFVAAQCAITGKPRWPPGTGDARFWLVWFTVPVAILGLLDALLRPPNWLRAAVLFVVAKLGLRALVAPLAAHADAESAWSMGTWVDGLAGTVALWWLALEEQSERLPGPAGPVVLATVLAGAAAVFGLSDNVEPSLDAAALAGMAAAAALLASPLRQLSLGRGAVLAFVVPPFALIAFIHFYSFNQPPVWSCALLGVAPLLVWVADAPGLRRIRRGRVILRLALVALAVGLAVGLAVRQSLHGPEGQNPPASSEDY